ncbi:MAG: hypothetical protein WDN28_11895 [Chthoniobacter sp.]
MQIALLVGLLHVEPGEQQRERKEEGAEIARRRLQDIRSLRAEKIFRHAAAKSRAETFILRALHEHQQNDEQRHEDVDH